MFCQMENNLRRKMHLPAIEQQPKSFSFEYKNYQRSVNSFAVLIHRDDAANNERMRQVTDPAIDPSLEPVTNGDNAGTDNGVLPHNNRAPKRDDGNAKPNVPAPSNSERRHSSTMDHGCNKVDH